MAPEFEVHFLFACMPSFQQVQKECLMHVFEGPQQHY